MAALRPKVPESESPEVMRTDIRVQSLLDAIAGFQEQKGWDPNRISRTLSCYDQAFPPLTQWLREQGLIGEHDHVGASGSVGQNYSSPYSTNHQIYISNVPQSLSCYESQVLLWNNPFLLKHAPGYINRLNIGKLPINNIDAWFFLGDDRLGYNDRTEYNGNISVLPELKQYFRAHGDNLRKLVLDRLGHGEDVSELREVIYKQLEGKDFRVCPEDLIPIGPPQTVSGLRLDRRAAYIVPLEGAVELQFPVFEQNGVIADGYLPITSDPKNRQYVVQFYKLKENARFLIK